MNVVGLAGRSGCGKSAVARALAQRDGVEWVDLDRIAWETYAPGTSGHQRLIDRFGRDILASDGTIDRRKLAATVFGDNDARRDLEAVVHPAITERFKGLKAQCRRAGIQTLLVEGALLASSPHVDPSDYDVILWLETSDNERRTRLQQANREKHWVRGQDVHPKPHATIVDASGSVDDVADRVWQVIERLKPKPD